MPFAPRHTATAVLSSATQKRFPKEEKEFMTDDEIRAEIAKQIHDALVLLDTKLRDSAGHRTSLRTTDM